MNTASEAAWSKFIRYYDTAYQQAIEKLHVVSFQMPTDRPDKNKNQFSKNMKLPVSKTNAPVWRDITVKSVLPKALKPLETLSRNLWWVCGTARQKSLPRS